MAGKSFLPVLHELARCYQAFEAYSGQHIRCLELTPCQFDIIATLGNTAGMSFRELGQKTLITKGTLTGVVDRLEEKKIVRRVPSPTDGRSQIVRLTGRGEKLFAEIFPAHLAHLDQAFRALSADELQETETVLHRLRGLFETPAEVQ